MILVAGATGLLGADICLRLRAEGQSVRALARKTANAARIEQLRTAALELAWGDLKDPGSLRDACRGTDTVISTASSTLSRQAGDSIETVDRAGQLALIDAARGAGVRHFTFVSIPRRPVRESPLTRAKAAAERALIESGMRTLFWRPTSSWKSGSARRSASTMRIGGRSSSVKAGS